MPAAPQILYACPSDDCVVLRVVGRGSFQNSVALKRTIQEMLARNADMSFIMDLRECSAMDSTFMGVLAGVGLSQRQGDKPRLTLVNTNPHVKRLLDTLGLSHFLDVRSADEAGAAHTPVPFSPADATPIERRQHILHMIQAHKELIHVDSANAVRFENVLKYLGQELDQTAANAPKE